MATVTAVVLAASAVVLFVAGGIGVRRIAEGPTQLDRSVALDLMVAITVAGIGLWTAWTDRATELPILVLLSLVGFTGAVGVARLVGDQMATRRRYYTQAEDDQAEATAPKAGESQP